jgi:hypothetical protein
MRSRALLDPDRITRTGFDPSRQAGTATLREKL